LETQAKGYQMNNLVDKTDQVYYEEDGVYYTLTAHYGLHKMEGQEAYFSITADLCGGGRLISCGCQHDLIAERMPHLIPLLKWHLCFVTEEPMHYESNGMFWWERSILKTHVPLYHGDNCAIDEKALQYFKDTIVYGTSETYDRIEESIFKYRNGSTDEKGFMRAWLKERLPEVMKSFRKDMKRFGIKVQKFQCG
jgi:hypothetical protein